MKNRSFTQNTSGQMLIVSSLLVAMLLLSTALYVIETTKQVPLVNADAPDAYGDYKQATRSTLISALANASEGGSSNILAADLAQLKTALVACSYQAQLTVDYTPLNTAPYQNGLWISWGTQGSGVSSAYATFSFASASISSSSTVTYSQNVTSEIRILGSYQQTNQTTKTVNLTLNIKNDGKAALAETFTFSFQNQTEWVEVPLPSITDFGDGAYSVTFYSESPSEVTLLAVSVTAKDYRGISVGATITCHQ